jgi:hypothetical protein
MRRALARIITAAIGALGAGIVVGLYLRFGWVGVGFSGIAVLFVTTMSELGENHPATRFTGQETYRNQYERAVKPGGGRDRAEAFVRRRWLGVARTIGLALCFLGFGMVALHF